MFFKKKFEDYDIYVVAVDSRGHSTSDMACYKEYTCLRSYFKENIIDKPKILHVKSQVAGMCGLNIDIYYHDHSPDHNVRHLLPSNKSNKSHFHISYERSSNLVATLLTFNPSTGFVQHKIYGKAYLILDGGKAPLSKRQVWGLQEFLKEAKELYRSEEEIHNCRYQLAKWCTQYQLGFWVPHSIYEPRRPSVVERSDSNISDEATCHHGATHLHHDGHHECCHRHTRGTPKHHDGGEKSHHHDNLVIVTGDENHHHIHGHRHDHQ